MGPVALGKMRPLRVILNPSVVVVVDDDVVAEDADAVTCWTADRDRVTLAALREAFTKGCEAYRTGKHWDLRSDRGSRQRRR
jgi:hypothetical protein